MPWLRPTRDRRTHAPTTGRRRSRVGTEPASLPVPATLQTRHSVRPYSEGGAVFADLVALPQQTAFREGAVRLGTGRQDPWCGLWNNMRLMRPSRPRDP